MKLIDMAIYEENKKLFVKHRDKQTIIIHDCPHRFQFYKNLCKDELSGLIAECSKKIIDCNDCWNQNIKDIQ